MGSLTGDGSGWWGRAHGRQGAPASAAAAVQGAAVLSLLTAPSSEIIFHKYSARLLLAQESGNSHILAVGVPAVVGMSACLYVSRPIHGLAYDSSFLGHCM